MDALGNIHTLDPEAALSIIGERAPEQTVGDLLGVGIIEHDRRVVTSELEREALEIGGGSGSHPLAGRGWAPKAYFSRNAVRADVSSQGISSTNDVEYARRQCTLKQFAHGQSCKWSVRRWLEHHGVARTQRGGDLPHGKSDWKIPGCNGCHHAERAADHFCKAAVIVLDDLTGQIQIRVVT